MKKRTLAGIVLATTVPFSLASTSAAYAAEGSLGALESFDVLGSLGTVSSPTPNPTPTTDPDPGTTPTTPTTPSPSTCPGTPRVGKITQQALFDATNDYRVTHGLTPFKPNATATDIVQQWHNSPGHRANMQNANFNTLGVGVAYAANGAVYAVQNFARY